MVVASTEGSPSRQIGRERADLLMDRWIVKWQQRWMLWFLSRDTEIAYLEPQQLPACRFYAEPLQGQDAVSDCAGRESRGRGEEAQSV